MQQLFKRVLLTLFPEEVTNNAMSPASVFVSFVAPKQFFSIINRRMVENYKLNLFDIALDPFEVKIGFGEQPTIRVKEVEFYYAYCAAANLNGYRFFSPANIAGALSVVLSPMIAQALKEKEDTDMILHAIFAIYLLVFVFQTRIKVFPEGTKEEQMDRFMDVYFEFYALLYKQTNQELSPTDLAEVRKLLLKQFDVFFTLFYVYKRINGVFEASDLAEDEVFQWLLYDEVKSKDANVKKFLKSYPTSKSKTFFSAAETEVLNYIFPADILLKYFFDDEFVLQVTQWLVKSMYDPQKVSEFMQGFLRGDEQLEEFFLFLMDYWFMRKNFFSGLQQYVLKKFSLQSDVWPMGRQEEIDAFLSSIGDGEVTDESQIPERIKGESQTLEKFVNFYITFIGGFWTGRGDSYYVRLCVPDLLRALTSHSRLVASHNEALSYYGGVLYSYSKNIFYYKYASDNIRAGKDRFNLPFKASFKEVYSNIFILRLFDENFIATLLQDISPKDIKIYVHHKHILSRFKKRYSKKISDALMLPDDVFLDRVYNPLQRLALAMPDMVGLLKQHLTSTHIRQIKEGLYTVDYRIQQEMYEVIAREWGELIEHYQGMSMVGILATMRETLLGFFLYLSYLNQQQQTDDKNYHQDIVSKLYCIDILNITEHQAQSMEKMIKQVYEIFQEVMTEWIAIDDNQEFFRLAFHNRKIFINNRPTDGIFTGVLGEDIIRLRGFLKNATYYNKRFLIPKE